MPRQVVSIFRYSAQCLNFESFVVILTLILKYPYLYIYVIKYLTDVVLIHKLFFRCRMIQVRIRR